MNCQNYNHSFSSIFSEYKPEEYNRNCETCQKYEVMAREFLINLKLELKNCDRCHVIYLYEFFNNPEKATEFISLLKLKSFM